MPDESGTSEQTHEICNENVDDAKHDQGKTTICKDNNKNADRDGGSEASDSNMMKNYFVNFVMGRKNLILRVIFGALLILFFMYVLYIGPIAIVFVATGIQLVCFSEMLTITTRHYRVNRPKYFKLIAWWFFCSVSYFCYGEIFLNYFVGHLNRVELLKMIVNYHPFLSYLLYMLGIVLFVLSLKGKYEMRQFSLLACCHVALALIVAQTYMAVQNCFHGLIWLAVPLTFVFFNDIMAYFCGKLFGKTRLIRVSPKKTWEGFIGAGILSIIFAFFFSYLLSHYPYFICPTEYDQNLGTYFINVECNPHEVFQLKNYSYSLNSKMLKILITVEMFPFVFHSVVFAFFASVIAPFGGFFASGFKRAFKVKDFGEFIPGHGGLLDRFDCQFLMATFVNVYISSFLVVKSTPNDIFLKFLDLDVEHQLKFYQLMKDSLANQNLLS